MNGQLQRKLTPWLLVSAGVLTVMVAVFVFQNPSPAQAAGGDLSRADAKYPQIVGSRLDSCSLCHTANIPGLNAYGADYLAKGRSTAAFAAIESLDSDHDGFTNLAEIQALTFPGNANDRPAGATATATQPPLPTATATVPPQPTHTATQPVLPTQTATQPPQPTGTATQPPAPTTTATQPPAPTSTETALPQPSATATVAPTTDPYPAPVTPQPTATQPVQLHAAADAYVAKDQPRANYGSEPSLKITDQPNSVAYLRFQLPELEHQKIEKVTLSLYVENSSGSGFSIHPTSANRWSEKDITYQHAPSIRKALAPGSGGAGAWVTVDVTALVRGHRSLALALVANQGSAYSFSSRETSNAPVLTIVTSIKSGDHDDIDQTGDDDD